MQNNSKKRIVKETRKVRARLSAIKGCSGVNQFRKLNKAAVNCFSRSINDAMFVDNGKSFMICPFCLIFAIRQLFPLRNTFQSIPNNAVSKFFIQDFS